MLIENKFKNMRKIDIRRVIDRDVSDLLFWRNDLQSRNMSLLNKERIAETNHRQWFEEVIDDPQRIIFIGMLDGAKVGMVRFDYLSLGLWRVSIIVNPQMRGKGLAAHFLHCAICEFSKGNTGKLLAEILSINLASVKVFTSCGFKRIDSKKMEKGQGVLMFDRDLVKAAK